MSDLTITFPDSVNIRITSEDAGILMELSEYFTFSVPGAKFMPAFRAKMWDGKIRLYNTRTGLIYRGILNYVKKFASERSYTIDFSTGYEPEESKISTNFANKFFTYLNPHASESGSLKSIKIKDFQVDAFVHAVNNDRCLLLSPTSSGKSLIIYGLVRFYLNQIKDKKILIVVPTTSLVEQMYSDFGEYSFNDPDKWSSEKNCHRIYSGKDKNTDKHVVITTWQSIYKLPPVWFDNFCTVIGDEAHNFQAKSLISILTKMKKTPFRFGTTGTIQESKTHKLVLEGLFGEVYKVITTKKLMDTKQIAQLNIKCLILEYEEEICKLMKKADYQQEFEYLLGHTRRNKFIRNLALSLKGNTLILFRLIEKHGKILHQLITEKCDGQRKIFFVYGKTDVENREEVRKIVELEKNAIIIASYGTYSQGVNIRNINNIIFASPNKSRIRNLQSIGRGLRISTTKQKLDLYDIIDDMRYKKHKNHTLRHFLYRVQIYNEEKFDYTLYKIRMKT
jgi:superfamily II DNA or RNA helicase